MKKLKLFIAFIFLTYGLSAQVDYLESIELIGLENLWIHQSLDTGVVVSANSNGSNKFTSNFYLNNGAINDDKYLFFLNQATPPSNTNPIGSAGGFLQKIDYRTGELIWATAFDLRNDSAQSKPYYYRILDDEIEILGFRNEIAPNQLYTSGNFELRYYSTEDGRLNNLIYSDTVPNLFVYFGQTTLMPVNGNYCFFNTALPSGDTLINSWKDEIFYFDNTANAYDTVQQVLFGQDSIKEEYTRVRSLFFIDDNKISNVVTYRHFYDNLKVQENILRIYDAASKEFKTFNITELINESNYAYEIVSMKDDDSATLLSIKYNPVFLNGELQLYKLMKFNLNDNTSKIVNLNYDNDSNFIASDVFELDNDKILAINIYREQLNDEEAVYDEYYKMLLLDKILITKSSKNLGLKSPIGITLFMILCCYLMTFLC